MVFKFLFQGSRHSQLLVQQNYRNLIEYLHNRPSQKWNDTGSIDRDVTRLQSQLDELGVTVIENVLDSITCEKIHHGLKEIIKDPKNQYKGKVSYKELLKVGDISVVRRDGRDEGMFDVFNFDKYLGTMYATEFDSIIKTITQILPMKKVQSVNAYFNSNVTSTRGMHVDTYTRQKFKAFLYLTDVETLDHGPYTYALYSHKDSELQSSNRSILGYRKTDSVCINYSNVRALTAKAGTLIISNQRGYHMGFPQNEKTRALISISFL